MGGKVLELESDKLIEQGLELGRLENQMATAVKMLQVGKYTICLLYTSPSPRD